MKMDRFYILFASPETVNFQHFMEKIFSLLIIGRVLGVVLDFRPFNGRSLHQTTVQNYKLCEILYSIGSDDIAPLVFSTC